MLNFWTNIETFFLMKKRDEYLTSNRGALSPFDSRSQLYSLAENTLENSIQWWVKYIICPSCE